MWRAPKCSADLTYHGVSGAEDVKCHPGGPEKQMLDLGVACADLSGGATDDCAGACRASWDANYTKCLEPFWQFIPAPFRPPFDRVKEACLAATAQAGAGAFWSCAYRHVRHTLLLLLFVFRTASWMCSIHVIVQHQATRRWRFQHRCCRSSR